MQTGSRKKPGEARPFQPRPRDSPVSSGRSMPPQSAACLYHCVIPCPAVWCVPRQRSTTASRNGSRRRPDRPVPDTPPSGQRLDGPGEIPRCSDRSPANCAWIASATPRCKVPRSAVSSDPPPRPGQRGEPVAAVVTDPVEQAVGDRLVSERKAPGGGFIQRCRDERDREVTPNNGRRLHEVAAAGGGSRAATGLSPAATDSASSSAMAGNSLRMRRSRLVTCVLR